MVKVHQTGPQQRPAGNLLGKGPTKTRARATIFSHSSQLSPTKVWCGLHSLFRRGQRPNKAPRILRFFLFYIFKKIKISKIYVRFGKFQKYTLVALWGATGLKCNFFSSNLQRSPWRKKKRGPVAHPRGDRALSPVGGATGSLFPFVIWA